jgi:hypothetical protein
MVVLRGLRWIAAFLVCCGWPARCVWLSTALAGTRAKG